MKQSIATSSQLVVFVKRESHQELLFYISKGKIHVRNNNTHISKTQTTYPTTCSFPHSLHKTAEFAAQKKPETKDRVALKHRFVSQS
jgi:hypothetical protein